ncbi:MAG: type II/IV secretion system protein, partial [Verrucomicrobiota bacterium]|nr:type II/IV secretion system protein [Verrucomicrobiota bacterium]
MTDLLIAPARNTGCRDIDGLSEVIVAAAAGQRSPLDDILDAEMVDEEPYMRTLATSLGVQWLDEIPGPSEPLPL